MKHIYQVVNIPNAEAAMSYADLVPGWCLSYDPESFAYYTHNGHARCFYLIRDDYSQVSEVRGEATPWDDFGRSVICVIVDGGKIINCTSRWNDPDEPITLPTILLAEIMTLVPELSKKHR